MRKAGTSPSNGSLPDSALSVSYSVGNHFISRLSAYKPPTPPSTTGSTTANEASRVLYPGFASVALGTSGDHGFYHSLQTQLTRRAGHGLTLFANFTYAKGIDLSTAGGQGVSTNIGLRDPFDLNLDKGPSDSNLNTQFKLASVYDIPFLHGGNAVLRALANGWAFNTHLGRPHRDLLSPAVAASITRICGVSLDHCDQVSTNVARPAGVSEIQELFNTAAFLSDQRGRNFRYRRAQRLRRPRIVQRECLAVPASLL